MYLDLLLYTAFIKRSAALARHVYVAKKLPQAMGNARYNACLELLEVITRPYKNDFYLERYKLDVINLMF